jgi:hypothetical protein
VDIGAYEYQGESLMGTQFVPDASPVTRETTDLRSQATSAVNVALASWSESLGRTAPVSVRVEIADLDGAQLAAGEILRRDNLGQPVMGRIVIDSNAAGLLWHSDPHVRPSRGSYDLYSVVLHEVGHVLGLEHSFDSDVMHATLNPGNSLLTLSLHETSAVQSLDLDEYLLDSIGLADLGPALPGSARFSGNSVNTASKRLSAERGLQIAVTPLTDRQVQLAVDAILEEYDLLAEMKRRKFSKSEILESEKEPNSDTEEITALSR